MAMSIMIALRAWDEFRLHVRFGPAPRFATIFSAAARQRSF
jgi:hypothetical protein